MGGRRINRMYYGEFENDQVFALKNVFFLFSGGNWPIYTWLRL